VTVPPVPLPEPPEDPTPPATDQVRIRRLPDRGRYDTEAVHAVLDAARVAHVGVVVDGRPVVIPMVFCRDADRLVLHGSVASRLLRSLAAGIEVCVTVTVLDGLVLARSTFHHSVNYRSVVVMGVARPIEGEQARRAALDALVEFLVPGRTSDARPPNPVELKKTLLIEVPIVEASVKVRTGGPVDDADDLALPVWAGIVPLTEVAGRPEPDELVAPDVAVPPYLTAPLP
jgi:nitroimidazol reductase NimA-like FMN-containing flavoprotein (pyridoxamine 5'-phosphate oxidase superfamily)